MLDAIVGVSLLDPAGIGVDFLGRPRFFVEPSVWTVAFDFDGDFLAAADADGRLCFLAGETSLDVDGVAFATPFFDDPDGRPRFFFDGSLPFSSSLGREIGAV